MAVELGTGGVGRRSGVGAFYRRERRWDSAERGRRPARPVMRLLGGVNGVGAGSELGVNGGQARTAG